MANIRIEQIDLVGGDRSVRFDGDLSIVKGSITTGKTTIVRLLRALLGRVPHHLPPETGTHLPAAGEYVAVHPTCFHLHEHPERAA